MSADVIPFPARDEPGPELVAGKCTRCGGYTERGRLWVQEAGRGPGASGIVHAYPEECAPLPPQHHTGPHRFGS